MRWWVANDWHEALVRAGIPSNVLFGPNRGVSFSTAKTYNVTMIQDSVFLPTEYELFGESKAPTSVLVYNMPDGELPHLSYYSKASRRIKACSAAEAYGYWCASVVFTFPSGSTTLYQSNKIVTSSGGSENARATDLYGIDPCFCVS
jgi:hypothetical protein